MVSVEDAISIYNLLSSNGIRVWLTGGWGIDALLGEQTRPHKDLDVIMLLDDVLHTWELFDGEGYCLKEIWSENRWILDEDQNKIATAFVLRDSDGREFYAHAMCLDDQGNGVPTWDVAEGFIFTKQDLAGLGLIAGLAVQCISPESQLSCHTGYELPEKQLLDIMRLRDKFKLKIPENLRY